MRTPRPHTIQAAMGTMMAAVGTVAAIAPRRFAASSGLASNAQTGYLTQMWAMREVALGGVLIATRNSRSRRPILASVGALAATEAVVSLSSSALEPRHRVTSAATASVFGLAAGYLWLASGARRP